MLTSFFGKSNPINYLILGIFIFAGYLWETFSGNDVPNTFLSFGFHAAFCMLSVLGMLLLDFIIRKNHLTKNNTFAILFFSCFMVMLPVIFSQQSILLANFFLLLSFRRMMSMRNDKNSSKKILDASIWITVASIFHFWSLLFFVPLWIAIIQKPNSNYKQMLIPITGFVAVLMINTAYQLLAADSYSWFLNWEKPISFDFSAYSAISVLVPVTIILAFYIWTGIYRILKISVIPLKEKPNYLLLLYISINTLLVALATPQKTGAEVLFLLAPIAIIVANYIENFETERYVERDAAEFWFKELLLWLVVVLPFIFLIL